MGYQIQFLSFFLKKPHTVWLKPEKPVLGHIFPHICGCVGQIVSKNNRVDHPRLPHSTPSEVEGVRIVVISFRNIAKKFRWKQWTLPTDLYIFWKFSNKTTFFLISFQLHFIPEFLSNFDWKSFAQQGTDDAVPASRVRTNNEKISRIS